MDEEQQIRQRRLQQFQDQLIQQQELQEQKRQLLSQLLEPKARERLANLRTANPDLADKAESLVIYLYQNGQIKSKITEEQLKEILSKLSQKRETKITFK